MKKKLSIATLLVMSFLLSGCVAKKPAQTEVTTPVKNSPEVVNLNLEWEKYTNNEYQYSIKIPTEFFSKQGSCIKPTNSQLYEYKAALSQSGVKESDNSVVIYPKTVYEISEDKTTCNLKTDTEKFENDMWNIKAFTSNTSEDLDSFIKKEFGQTCSLEVLKPTTASDIYDVIVSKNETCQISDAYFFKYNQKSKTAVYILLGNKFTFSKDENFGNNAYDEEMLSSFEFLN